MCVGWIETRLRSGPIMRKEKMCRDCGKTWLQIVRSQCPSCGGRLHVVKPPVARRDGAVGDVLGVFDDDE